MQIIEDSPARLVLRRRPVFLAGVLMAGVLLTVLGALQNFTTEHPEEGLVFLVGTGIVLVLMLLFVQQDIAVFDRAAGQVLHTRQTLIGARRTALPLASIRRADVQRSGGGKSTPSWRTILLLRDGAEHRLVARYTKGGGARRAADRINAWLPAR